jgi:hypothetical protein
MNVIHFCMSEWLKTPNGQDERSLTHTEVYYVHQTVTHSYRSVSSCPFGVFSHSLIQKCTTFILPLWCLQSITCMSEWLKTPKGQDERNTLLYEWVTEDTREAIIQKCMTFILPLWCLQSLTHTEVYYVHQSVTHSYRSVLPSSCPFGGHQRDKMNVIHFCMSEWLKE